MKGPLPAWVVDDATSIRREAQSYVQMTNQERAKDLAAACRLAARILASRRDSEVVLQYRDPLPKSTLQALERLRREARRNSGGNKGT